MDKKKIFEDKKIKKSLLNLKYLAYFFLISVIILGFGVTTYFGYKLYNENSIELKYIIMWEVIFYITTIMIVLGIKDVLSLLSNLDRGNIFTIDNAEILRKIDKKLLFTLFFSLIINIIMVIINNHHPGFLAVWLVFIMFILAGHILVKPLSLLVEKSAEMKIEMDLTI